MTAPSPRPTDSEHPRAAGGGPPPLAAFLASVAVAILTAILAVSAWNLMVKETQESGDLARIERSRVAVARVAREALFLGFAAAYSILGRRRRPPFLAATGFVPARHAVRSYALGFLAGVLPVVALIGLLLALGARTVDLRWSPEARGWWFLGKYVLLGVLLVVAEEGVFRGLILGDLVRALGSAKGAIASAVFFAATHFLGVSPEWRAVPDPAPGGLDVVGATFAGCARLFHEWPEFVGLSLVGAILAILRLRTGSLWLGMGVHAGWYWIKQIDRKFVDAVDPIVRQNQFWLGSEQYLDGVLGWAALIATLLVCQRLRLTAAPTATPRSPEP